MTQPVTIEDWCKYVHDIAKSKGWHEGEITAERIGTWLALIHSEVSEALEELRSGREKLELYTVGEQGYDPKPEGFVVEMADAVIRIMDVCQALDLDLEGAMRTKCLYNQTRPVRHGGKRV